MGGNVRKASKALADHAEKLTALSIDVPTEDLSPEAPTSPLEALKVDHVDDDGNVVVTQAAWDAALEVLKSQSPTRSAPQVYKDGVLVASQIELAKAPCPNCGMEIFSDAAFCRHCGFNLASSQLAGSRAGEETAQEIAPTITVESPQEDAPKTDDVQASGNMGKASKALADHAEASGNVRKASKALADHAEKLTALSIDVPTEDLSPEAPTSPLEALKVDHVDDDGNVVVTQAAWDAALEVLKSQSPTRSAPQVYKDGVLVASQ